jgi:hypothetical protein
VTALLKLIETSLNGAQGSDRAIKALNGEEPDFYIYEDRSQIASFSSSCACIFTNHKGHVDERFGKSSDLWPRVRWGS